MQNVTSTAINLGFIISLIGSLGCSSTLEETSSVNSQPSIQQAAAPKNIAQIDEGSSATFWRGLLNSADWMNHWQTRSEGAWGSENLEIIESESNRPDQTFLRVHYPAGSASPSVSRRNDVPLGGTQFYADLNMSSQERLKLSYRVRFSENFDFVKGGKLPGLFGGDGASGGNIPDGTDGFSTRLMWRRNGDGEVYAYLPTSENYGTSIGRGSWQFRPGAWVTVTQEVTLNQPGEENGRIRLWVDDDLVIDESELVFRSVETLKIDGIFFSTFFGGGDASWATPEDVYVDFADFIVTVPQS